jgi:hypothetical protein
MRKAPAVPDAAPAPSHVPTPPEFEHSALFNDAQALLAKLKAACATAGSDAAGALKAAETQLGAAVTALGSVVGKQALTDAQKLEQAVAAELTAQVPVIVSAVVTALLAAVKAGVPAAALAAGGAA